jgi:hypothetical protein
VIPAVIVANVLRDHRSATAMLDSGVQLAYQVARSKWKRRRFISLFLACSRSSGGIVGYVKAGSTASIIAGGNHRGFAARSGISLA